MSSPPIKIRYSERRERRRDGVFARLDGWVRSQVSGQVWWYRAPLIPVLIYFLWQHLNDFNYSGIYDGLNLIIHEAGHPLFGYTRNEFLTAAGGTLFEMMCPIFAGIMFYRQRDIFAMTVSLFWLGTTFLHTAPYTADARVQRLPLVSIGDGPVGHDWFNMLFRLGWLHLDQEIARGFYWTGIALLTLAIAAGARVLWLMREEASMAGPGGGSGGVVRPPKDEGARFADFMARDAERRADPPDPESRGGPPSGSG